MKLVAAEVEPDGAPANRSEAAAVASAALSKHWILCVMSVENPLVQMSLKTYPWECSFVFCQPIRQHVQLQMKESTRYEEVRAAVLAYENVSSTWTTSKVHSEFGIGNQPPQQHQGLAPMEIDRDSNPNWNQPWNNKGGKFGKSGKVRQRQRKVRRQIWRQRQWKG